MKNLILLHPKKERNGIMVKKTINNLNSCELRKISLSGRDNGYISSVNQSGAIVATGTTWRGKLANSPISDEWLQILVERDWEKIKEIIQQ